MTDVVIVGIGQIKVDEHWDLSLREIGGNAAFVAMQDAGLEKVDALYVSNIHGPTITGQSLLGGYFSDWIGLWGLESVRFESGEASGGSAIRQALSAIRSGDIETALVLGAEKLTDARNLETNNSALLDADYDAINGLTLTSQAALLQQRYIYEHKIPRYGLSQFAIQSYAKSLQNPYALTHRKVAEIDYRTAPIVCDPINALDMAASADGAAAVILTRSDLLTSKQANPVIRISGSSVCTDSFSLVHRSNILRFEAVSKSIAAACEEAQIDLADLDIIEFCDTYSIYTVLAIEAAGLAEYGAGWRFLQDHKANIYDAPHISTMGGSLSRGNVGGAIGVYQAVEASLQLRNQAGKNQLPNARSAMIQAVGGPASIVTTHILELLE